MKKKATKVQTRHYCNKCGAKRFENVMEITGKGAFGKDSWSCKTCGDSRFYNPQKRTGEAMNFKMRYTGSSR